MRVPGVTVAVIQARTGSKRLPGKVLKRLEDRTVLAHVIDRVRAATGVDDVVIATTTMAQDDAIEIEALKAGTSCHRGSEDDVLERTYDAARAAHADSVIRVTSDCPLYDPDVLSVMIKSWHQLRSETARVDYLSNTLKRTFPRGLDTEIFTFEALEKAHHFATVPEEREHVTLHIYRHPETFRLENFESEKDLPDLRWTLDTTDDWRFIQEIYARLYRPGMVFSTDDVLRILDLEPTLRHLNAHVQQKEVGGH